ncbi:GIY-YIG nuclease family protein [Burkholderia sp. 22313]|uniref:GIY-YIG nuclease family protein n=1 Tax=Burkholderia sp. 22313 TaxID=3453908 RepID=UPI003F8770F2
MSWFLYLIECVDDSVYTGITNDVAARFDQHASGKGARYTRSRKPRALLASFPLPDRSIASRVEYWVKRLTAAQKRELAAGTRTLASVLPAGMPIDGCVVADGLQAGQRGRKKVKDKGAEIATQPADTDKPARKTAKVGNDGKASGSTKTRIAKPGPTAPAPATAKAVPGGGALPARMRARKKPAPRATPRAKQNRAAS